MDFDLTQPVASSVTDAVELRDQFNRLPADLPGRGAHEVGRGICFPLRGGCVFCARSLAEQGTSTVGL